MGSAQLENGFTRIANELLDKIIEAGFSKRQSSILWAVIRKTYGYNKKTDDMTISQLATKTGMHRTHASRAFHELVDAGVLTCEKGRYGYVTGLNKAVAEWRVADSVRTKTATPSTVPKQLQGAYQNSYTDRTKTATDPVPKQLHTKDNPQKTTPKDNSKRCDGGSSAPSVGKKTPSKSAATKRSEPKTTEVWQAYCQAYLRRYGTEPTRNQKVNAQLSQFIDRVGKEIAPHVAAYFVSLNNRWYVTKVHAVGVMVSDAEALVTQWKTNRSVTDTQARQSDRTENNRGVWERLLEKERAKQYEH